MFDLAVLMELLGDGGAAALAGGVLGSVFGALAHYSGFCFRSAVLDANRQTAGQSVVVWLAALGAGIAVAGTAGFTGWISLDAIQLRVNGASVSGALAGGLLFGFGMVLARGCASRHLVLAGGGNGRAVVTFALFAATAWAAISGPLVAVREAVGGLWVIGPAATDAGQLAGLGMMPVAMAGGAIALLAGAFAVTRGMRAGAVLAGLAIGGLIAGGWVVTSALASKAFEPMQVETLAFTAPAAQALAAAIAPSGFQWNFDLGLVPGVFMGALAAALLSGGLRWQWFASFREAGRYASGAGLMGLGGVLAVGCSMGALGHAVLLTTTSLTALVAMAAGASIAYHVFDAPRERGLGRGAGQSADAAQLTVSGAVMG